MYYVYLLLVSVVYVLQAVQLSYIKVHNQIELNFRLIITTITSNINNITTISHHYMFHLPSFDIIITGRSNLIRFHTKYVDASG